MKAPHRRRIVFAGVAVGLAVTLALLEATCRVLFPLPLYQQLNRLDYSPKNFSELVPGRHNLRNAQIRYESLPDHAQYTAALNLYGFRDRQWGFKRHIDAPILFVGDSFVEGFLTDNARTTPFAFEEMARKKGIDRPIFNAGVTASGFSQYGQVIRDLVPLIKPRTVILVVFENDFVPTEPFPAAFFNTPAQFSKTSPWVPRSWTLLKEFRAGQPITRRWLSASQPFFPPTPSMANPWTLRPKASHVLPELEAAMRAGTFNPFAVDEIAIYDMIVKMPTDLSSHLQDVKRYLDAHDCHLSLVYIPYPAHVNPAYVPYKLKFSERPAPATAVEIRQHAQALARWSVQLGIPFLDLTDAIVDYERSGKRLFWDYDIHFRPEGYVWAGERIFEFWDRVRPEASHRGK